MIAEDFEENLIQEEVLLTQDVTVYQSIVNKIDYNASARALKFKPHPAQQIVFDTVASRAFDVITLACGRRFGKSEVMSAIASTELLIPNARVLLVTPTFANAKAIYDKVELAIIKLGLKIKSKDIKLLTFTLEYGQTIICATPKSISNVLGFKYSLVIFDESQDISDLMEIWENKINPAQADYGLQEDGFMYSKTMFIGTVRDYDNDFYIPFERGELKLPGYISFNFPTSANPYISKEYLAKKEATLPKKTFDMEYRGIWQSLRDSLVYFSFNQETSIIKREEVYHILDNPKVCISGIDFGFDDNTSYLLGVVEPLTGIITIIREYKESQQALEYHVSKFREIESSVKYLSIHRYADPSAVQLIHDMSVTYGYYVNKANNKIDEGVDKVNSLFHQGKLRISEECVELISEIKNLSWKNPKTKEVARTKRHKHFDLSLSSLRYLVYTWEQQKDLSIIIIPSGRAK
jgi:hypothetical protein